MRVFTGSAAVPAEFHGAVAAIGNFDGLHRGHQTLLEVAQNQAERLGRPWGIVTFEPHPRTYFKPSQPVFRLTPEALKARLAAALGATFMVVFKFDAEFSDLEPFDFVKRHLVDGLGVSQVVMGYDFHFGRGRRGSPATMQQLGGTLGFGTTVVDQVSDEGDAHSPFSSSAIRESLRHGQVAEAAKDLGYHWTVMGDVVQGDQRGRTIGYPTVNIQLDPGAEPFRGIYAVKVRNAAIRGHHHWAGAGYFGERPTFDTGRTFLEAYLLDFDGNLYGHTLLVEFIDLIRPDRRFESITELTAQMARDCDAVRVRLAQEAKPLPFPLARMQFEAQL